MLQYVAVCCSMLQSDVTCCSVSAVKTGLSNVIEAYMCVTVIYGCSTLQHTATHCNIHTATRIEFRIFRLLIEFVKHDSLSSWKMTDWVRGKKSCITQIHVRTLLYNASVAVCMLQCVAVCCSVLQCVAVCCSALQCVAVCCSVLQWLHVRMLLYNASVTVASCTYSTC